MCVCVCVCVCVCACVCVCVGGTEREKDRERERERERERKGTWRGFLPVLIERNSIFNFDAVLLRSSINCAQRSHNVVAMSRHFHSITSFITLLCYIYTSCIKVRT